MVSVPKESVESGRGSEVAIAGMHRTDGVMDIVRNRARELVGFYSNRVTMTAQAIYDAALEKGYRPVDLNLTAAAVFRLAKYAEEVTAIEETHTAFHVPQGSQPGRLSHECIRVAAMTDASQYFVPHIAHLHGLDMVAGRAAQLLAQNAGVLNRLPEQRLFKDYLRSMRLRASAAVKLAAELEKTEEKIPIRTYSEDDYVSMKRAYGGR